ncbi:MAG TPA: type VI secretion system tip protein TssI/VgrG [Polyangiaceae bacterium]
MTLLRTARVFTTLGDDVLLFFSMDGTESLGQPFEYEVDLLSTDEQLDLTKLLGQPMVVALELPNLQIRQFTGYVTRFVLTGTLGRYVRYRATLRPWLWMMTRRSNCRIFQNKTVPQVVMALFREHGFSDFEDKLSSEYRSWEYLVQYRESDFNFVSRMMEQEGIYYYFRQAEGKHTLVLSDSYSAHKLVPGYEVVPYNAHSRDHVIEDHIDTWRAVRQITSGAFTADDYDFQAPRAKLGSTLQPGSDYPGGDYEIYDYPGEFADNKQADEQVKLQLHAELAQHDIVRGAGNARGLHAGALMQLSDFPRPDQNKEYLLISTTLSIRSEGYESLIDATAAPEEPNFRVSFSAIDSKRNFRVPRSTPKPVVRGPQTAVVVGQKDQEIWTDEYARVKLQFRWDREGTYDENSSCWVRVAQLWAGSGWGGIHIPRIGQEVIVDFLEGNPDRPIITGRLYNADNMPPYDLPTNQTQSGIKSHSTKGGGQDNFNEIKFEDKKGEEVLNIQAEKDMTTLVKNNQTNTIKASRSSSTGGSDSVSVGGDRSLSVTGKRTVTVTKSDTEDYKDARTTTVKGPDKLTVTLAHDGTYNNARTATITNLDTTTAKGGKKTDVTGNYDISASAKYYVKQGANELTLTGSQCKLTNGKSTLTLDGGKITIEAPEEIELKVGGNTIKIASGGTIDVTAAGAATVSGGKGGSLACDSSGANVGGPKVSVAGQGAVEVTGSIIKLN